MLQYHLLLAEQLKRTPEDSKGYPLLLHAVHIMKQTAQHINTSSRQHYLKTVLFGEVTMERTLGLAERLADLPCELEELGDLLEEFQDTTLHSEGSRAKQQKASQRHVFVFRNALLSCKPKEKSLHVKEFYQVGTCTFRTSEGRLLRITPLDDPEDISVFTLKNAEFGERLDWLVAIEATQNPLSPIRPRRRKTLATPRERGASKSVPSRNEYLTSQAVRTYTGQSRYREQIEEQTDAKPLPDNLDGSSSTDVRFVLVSSFV